MRINLTKGTTTQGINVATFATMKAAKEAAKGNGMPFKAELPLGFLVWVVVESSLKSLPDVRFIRYMGKDGVFREHAHPGYISGNHKVSVN